MSDQQSSDSRNWWCPHCEAFVTPEQVTHTEHHDDRSGGCGYKVMPYKPEPPTSHPYLLDALRHRANEPFSMHPDAWLETKDLLTIAASELERLRAENLTLRNVGVTQAEEIERLKRGEFICSRCQLRKDGEVSDVNF